MFKLILTLFFLNKIIMDRLAVELHMIKEKLSYRQGFNHISLRCNCLQLRIKGLNVSCLV
jgi:hypothetical protein